MSDTDDEKNEIVVVTDTAGKNDESKEQGRVGSGFIGFLLKLDKFVVDHKALSVLLLSVVAFGICFTPLVLMGVGSILGAALLAGAFTLFVVPLLAVAFGLDLGDKNKTRSKLILKSILFAIVIGLILFGSAFVATAIIGFGVGAAVGTGALALFVALPTAALQAITALAAVVAALPALTQLIIFIAAFVILGVALITVCILAFKGFKANFALIPTKGIGDGSYDYVQDLSVESSHSQTSQHEFIVKNKNKNEGENIDENINDSQNDDGIVNDTTSGQSSTNN